MPRNPSSRKNVLNRGHKLHARAARKEGRRVPCLGPGCTRTIPFTTPGERRCDDCRRKVEQICRTYSPMAFREAHDDGQE